MGTQCSRLLKEAAGGGVGGLYSGICHYEEEGEGTLNWDNDDKSNREFVLGIHCHMNYSDSEFLNFHFYLISDNHQLWWYDNKIKKLGIYTTWIDNKPVFSSSFAVEGYDFHKVAVKIAVHESFPSPEIWNYSSWVINKINILKSCCDYTSSTDKEIRYKE